MHLVCQNERNTCREWTNSQQLLSAKSFYSVDIGVILYTSQTVLNPIYLFDSKIRLVDFLEKKLSN